jgi:hypothetical protein
MAQQGQRIPPPASVDEDVPDPDEDDLDDLDGNVSAPDARKGLACTL